MNDARRFQRRPSRAAARPSTVGRLLRALPGLLLTASVPLLGQQPEEVGSYSYFATVEGSASLFPAGTDEGTPVEVNLPLLVGDRLWVGAGSRLTLLLSDRNRLRLDGDSELVFERLAGSPDGEDRETQLNLLEGRLLVTVAGAESQPPDDGNGPPRIDTANATVYLPQPGTYLIEANRHDWTRVVTRGGSAEVLTRRGASLARSGEEVQIEGETWPQVTHDRAPAELELERWAQRDDEILAGELDDELAEPLHSQAGGLSEHGEWVSAGGRRAWRPHVEVGWRPYWRGRWAHTPSGLYWVSYDPWSSITFHYGSWYDDVRFGWVWHPGYHYAPAHVYWYWGPSYAAWIPTGYYHHFYGHHRPRFGFDFGHHFGTYGFVGGSWGHYRHWTFCPTYYVGHHAQHYHHQHHNTARRTLAVPEVPRGILTTDTRGLTPEHVRRPELVRKVLVPSARPGARVADLPDVTPFVAREVELPETVRRQFPTRSGGEPAAIRTVTSGAGPTATAATGGAAGPVTRRQLRPASGPERRDPRTVVPVSPASAPGPSGSRPTPSVSEPGSTQRRPLAVPERPEVRVDARRTVRSDPARRVLDPIRQRTNRTSVPDRRPISLAPPARPSGTRPIGISTAPSRPTTATPSPPPDRSVTRPSPSQRPTTETRQSVRPAVPSSRPTSTRPPRFSTRRPNVEPARPSTASPSRRTVRPATGRSTTTQPASRPSSVQRSRPSSVQRSRPPAVTRSRPSSVQRSRPPAVTRSRPSSVQRSRPPAVTRSRPSSVQRTRPPAVTRSRPSSVQRSRPPAVTRSRPSSVQRSRPPAVTRSRPSSVQRSRPTARPSSARPSARSRPASSGRPGGSTRSPSRASRRPPG